MNKLTACVLIFIIASQTNGAQINRQFPEPQQPFRVIGSNNYSEEPETIQVIGQTVPELTESPAQVEEEEEGGILDTFLGSGAQSRIVESINDWVVDKAKTNPGCVERFVCETYKNGETFSGIPYFLITLTNAAVSFMVAELFDKSVDVQEITKAARYGKTQGTCHIMECEVLDNNLRNVGDYLGTFEDFITSIFSSLANSISIGK